ncbi:MAG: glycosyltransferase family 4 protein [Planctomycetes bacterium]|nr:glycosyltransferase family 4 protein [Planctomycetota bacterium]
MKVLMLSHSYYPDDPRVRREAEALCERGDHVEIICLRENNERRIEIINRIKVHRLPVKRHRGSGLLIYLTEYLLFFILARIKAVWLYLERRYDIIQVHTIPDWLVLAVAYPLKIFGARIILDMHEVMPEFFAYRYGLPMEHPLISALKLAEKLSTGVADRIITVSDTLKDILVSRGVPADKITVVMNAADERIFNPKAHSAIRNSQSAFVISYHGLLSDIYDLSVVFRALVNLKDRINIKFIIIGRGPQETYYRNMVNRLGLNDIVSFRGHLSQEEVVGIISSVDVGIVPLKDAPLTQLAFPTKLVEYVALGIPVITADRKTIKQYFTDNAVALYKPDDETSLQEILLNLYNNPELCNNLASNARLCYEKISWPIMKEKYYKLVDTITECPKSVIARSGATKQSDTTCHPERSEGSRNL